MSDYIDLEAIRAADLHDQPYPYCVAVNCIKTDKIDAIEREFPAPDQGGSFPADRLPMAASCQALIDELQGPALRRVVAEKFGVDLDDRPTLVTLRGFSRANKDGRIHNDSKSKYITVLLYLNRDWRAATGKLRILNGNDDLDDYAAEIVPEMGTMVLFRVTGDDWHGYRAFEGRRRAVQLNYMIDKHAVSRHTLRHRLSAGFKRLLR